MPASPSTDNYYVGKGVVTFKPAGGAYADVGNVSSLEITFDIKTLDHFSSRSGVKKKDKSIILEKSATVTMIMDEWTAQNIAMAVLGTVGVGGAISIFSKSEIAGSLKYTGANDIGPRVDIELLNVSFRPGGSLNPLSDEWGQIELTGEVLADSNGDFGTVTVTDQT